MKWWYLYFPVGVAFLFLFLDAENHSKPGVNHSEIAMALSFLAIAIGCAARLFYEQAKRIAALETEVATLKNKDSSNAATPSG